MALHPSSQIQNLKTSVEKYIYTYLTVAESITTDFEGIPFESGVTGVNEWIQPRIFSLVDSYWKPKSSTTRRGNVASALLNVNCFVKKDWVVTANRHYVLRDKVVEVLLSESGASIPLRDYSGGTTRPYTCLIKVGPIETDTVIPSDDHLQYNVTLELQWIREFT